MRIEVSRTDHSCHATDEPDEAEPSLGWVGIGQGIHGLALPGYADDREEENEHGGDVLDEPRDAEVEGDREPWLGVQSRHLLERVEFESLWVGCPAF